MNPLIFLLALSNGNGSTVSCLHRLIHIIYLVCIFGMTKLSMSKWNEHIFYVNVLSPPAQLCMFSEANAQIERENHWKMYAEINKSRRFNGGHRTLNTVEERKNWNRNRNGYVAHLVALITNYTLFRFILLMWIEQLSPICIWLRLNIVLNCILSDVFHFRCALIRPCYYFISFYK